MKLIIPPVVRSREELSFDATGELLTEHVPYIDDFCKACGADWKIRRVLVDNIPYEPLLRYILASLAQEAKLCNDKMARDYMALIKISAEDQARLTELFCEGIEPEVLYVHCGLEDVELGGITEEGTFLYFRNTPSIPQPH